MSERPAGEGRPSGPGFELRAQTSGMGLLDPRTAGLVWGAGSIVVGLVITYFLAQGDLRSIVLVLLCLIGLASLSPRRGVYILLIFLPFMYFLRRLMLTVQEFDTRDPILLFPAVTTIAMFFGVILFNRRTVFHYARRSGLFRALLALMFVLALQVVNPLQGSVLVGLGGALYFIVPMAWCFFGLLMQREDIDRIFRILVVIGCVTALYGLYQHYWGLAGFEIYEMRSKGFLKSFGGASAIRIMSTFSSLGDFSLYLAVASVPAFAFFWRTKQRFTWLAILALFLYTMVWTAVRTSFLIVLFSALILMVLYGRNTRQIVARGLVVLLAVVLFYGAFSYIKPEKVYNTRFSTNPYVVHTVSGITNPTQEGSFHGRLLNWADVIRTTVWPYPVGRGLGSTTTAAGKFGGVERTVDSYFFELFHNSGFLGPPFFIILMILTQSGLLRLCLQRPDVYTYRVALALTSGLFLGSVFGLTPRDLITGPLVWLLLGWVARETVDEREAAVAPEEAQAAEAPALAGGMLDARGATGAPAGA